MVMRYHWSLAVGHVYAQQPLEPQDGSGVNPPFMSNIAEVTNDDSADDEVDQCQEEDIPHEEHSVGSDDERDVDFQSDRDSSDSEDIEEAYDDVDALAFDEMYGDFQNYEVYD
jgi:hypothetical protein